jgi:hypothetical protein
MCVVVIQNVPFSMGCLPPPSSRWDIVVLFGNVNPTERPWQLLKMRSCEILNRERHHVFNTGQIKKIIDIHPDELNRLLRENRIELRNLGEDKNLAEDLMRLANRDHARWNEFYEDEKSLIGAIEDRPLLQDERMLVMNKPDSGLGEPSELHMLLKYLRDCMHFTPACYSRNSEGRLMKPRTVSPQQWHCTPQEHWVQEPFRLLRRD